MHESSMENMRRFIDKYLNKNKSLKIADIGSREVKGGSYRRLFANQNWLYTGYDIVSGPNVDVVLKHHYTWREITPESVDVAISGQTFEHIEFPWMAIESIYIILKPGGLCCIIAPSNQKIHRYPVDCWRFLPDGFRALARWTGLDVLECHIDDKSKYGDCVLICRK